MLDNISLLGRNVTCIPGEVVESFSKNSHVRSLPASEQDIYKRICGGGGYEGGSYSIAFPYMSPDNNSALFSTSFAELFTLDGLGVKRKGKK